MRSDSNWPESFGFSIVGDGPCYVYSVAERSSAKTAGLSPGDQLLEIDGHDITNMSASAVRILARHSNSTNPTVGVVSRVRRIELVASRRWGYGLAFQGINPTVVESVDPPGPAYEAGIRAGDIVLEINGRSINNLDKWSAIIGAKMGRIQLSIIPVESRNAASVRHRPRAKGSRIRQARVFFDKMNMIIGNDFEKKMTVIGLLKQYSQTRDVEIFSEGLSSVLTSSQHRKLIKEIRPFVPVKQRLQFDAILSRQTVNSSSFNSTRSATIGYNSNKSSTTDGRHSTRLSGDINGHRLVKVDRLDGSFGFVLRGHNPVLIESVMTGGPADRAGLQVGDAILKITGLDVSKCGHNHLVQLLQNSGTSPILEVKRGEDSHTVLELQTTDSASDSSTSCHESEKWFSDDNYMDDRSGATFKQRVAHLLTAVEKSALRAALMDYNASRNIYRFYDDTSAVLDTPSKRSLWCFLLPRMSTEDQAYITKRADIPKKDALTRNPSRRKKSNLEHGSLSTVTHSGSAVSYMAWRRGLGEDHHLGSFRKQLEYLLTSRERLQLRKALQIYSEKRNVHNLLEDLMDILDTPSKRTLWLYIIPLLSGHHQQYCVRQLGLPAHVIRSSSPSKEYKYDDVFTSASPRHGDLLYRKTNSELNGKPHRNVDLTDTPDVYVTSDMRNERLTSVRSTENSGDPQQMMLRDAEQSTVTYGPIYAEVDKDDKVDIRSTRHKVKMVRESGAQTTPAVSPLQVRRSKIRHAGNQSSTLYDHLQRDTPSLPPIQESDNHSKVRAHQESCSKQSVHANEASLCNGVHQTFEKPLRTGQMACFSDAESEFSAERTSNNSYDSFQTRAMHAIQELDDVVANEKSANSENDYAVAPPVPPPLPPLAAPPLPPPLPPSLQNGPGNQTATSEKVNNNMMNVKRINWEKIDVANENTVWAKMGDSNDLEDIVKYLELEHQFSTKRLPAGDPFQDRKNEVVLISAKKAYNISILLGHLKMSAEDIKQALCAMDEDLLTPELLKQMLAYAPNGEEVEKYDAYKGSLHQLSKPDRFAYEMSRLPGYEQRLRAMVFKASFSEKIHEVMDNLKCIRKASQELQQSRKLSRVLELVLAMGNYMNKGHTRIGHAVGFKVHFLAMLDLTKTSDGKATFLNVLADTVYSKFPQDLNFADQLPTVPEAAKLSNAAISQELADLRKVLQDISATVKKLGCAKQRIGTNDRFHEVMEHFISKASDEIQGLFSLQANTTKEFHQVVEYFGEDPKNAETIDIFTIFADFMAKFEKAHTHNIMYKRQHAALTRNNSSVHRLT